MRDGLVRENVSVDSHTKDNNVSSDGNTNKLRATERCCFGMLHYVPTFSSPTKQALISYALQGYIIVIEISTTVSITAIRGYLCF